MPVLNVVAINTPAPRRPSRSRWRVGSLLAVHLGIAAHVAHHAAKGRTLSPVEPSEAMAAIEAGWVNAGAVFLAVVLVMTLVFGRFFCGWGCHVVALQDLSLWLLRRVGIRPRPVRSRLLAIGPWLLAAYLFAWPSVLRLARGQPRPSLTIRLWTDDLWASFPGPVIAALTFAVCGFLAVYLLGAKGFCTYGCPYGALFRAADRLAPGRIVASEACEGCGRCTAACTSNVLVHEEVRRYGRVDDPGCMKCMDCVSVCPTGALGFGFVNPLSPGVGRAGNAARTNRRYDYTWAEESAMGLTAAASTLAFRGVYDGPPLLLAVCLGALTAVVALKLIHMLCWRGVTIHGIPLIADRRPTRAGWAFAGLAVVWLGFTVHCAAVQWYRASGRYHLERTGLSWAELTTHPPTERPPRHDTDAVARAHASFRRADRWGFLGVAEVKLGLAWTEILLARPVAAEHCLREAIRLNPGVPQLHDRLIEFLRWQGRAAEATEALASKIASVRPSANDRFRLASWLAGQNRTAEAAAHYRAGLALEPQAGNAHYELGRLLLREGDLAPSLNHLNAAQRLLPDQPAVELELALALARAGAVSDALAHLQRVERNAPGLAAPYLELRDRLPGPPLSTDRPARLPDQW